MTGNTTMDKERLAAFADGELTPEEAAEVAMHLADHPEDQAWVDDLMAANVQLRRAYGGIAAEPVPERFTRLIMPQAQVVSFRPRQALRYALGGAALALAAGLAAVALLPGNGAGGLRIGPVTEGSALHAALQGQPSGEAAPFAGSGTLTVLATLPADDTLCREFELSLPAERQLQLGIACRQPQGWTVEVMLAEAAAPPADATGYVPAFGAEAQALDAWLDARGAGMVLGAAEEAALIARGWTQAE
jgi:anti-sigma factor RsiW